jgi:hypothetical protein
MVSDALNVASQMLPDFIRVKRNLNRNLVKWMQLQIPLLTPLLVGIATFRQHEGKQARITRTDKSEGKIEYHQLRFEFAMSRDEMKCSTLPAIQEKLLELAKRVGLGQLRKSSCSKWPPKQQILPAT